MFASCALDTGTGDTNVMRRASGGSGQGDRPFDRGSSDRDQGAAPSGAHLAVGQGSRTIGSGVAPVSSD